jgi:hypothetical protein
MNVVATKNPYLMNQAIALIEGFDHYGFDYWALILRQLC